MIDLRPTPAHASRFSSKAHEGVMKTPFIILIAGPNGIGKTSFATWYLQRYRECSGIIDPDEIARSLDIEDVAERNIAAGRRALQSIESRIDDRQSFAIETTLSGKTLAGRLIGAESMGYRIQICLLRASTPLLTAARVARRVRAGGHDIPIATQKRRFDRSYRNFHEHYIEVCHEWSIYDAERNPPRIISSGSGGFST